MSTVYFTSHDRERFDKGLKIFERLTTAIEGLCENINEKESEGPSQSYMESLVDSILAKKEDEKEVLFEDPDRAPRDPGNCWPDEHFDDGGDILFEDEDKEEFGLLKEENKEIAKKIKEIVVEKEPEIRSNKFTIRTNYKLS